MATSKRPTQLDRPQRLAEALRHLRHPVTIRQLARKMGINPSAAASLVRSLRRRGRLCCLNPGARHGRVYQLAESKRSPQADLDWDLYGWLCFSQRRAVLIALDHPLQPSEIKRRARYLDPNVRMSANNVRDVIKHFHERGLVTKVFDRRRPHCRYQLTEQGEALQRMMLMAEASE